MTIGEIIKEYRESQYLSQREFAKICDLSNAYISLLEAGKNPKTGRPISPDMKSLAKISKGLGCSLNDLFIRMEGETVSLENSEVRAEFQKLPTARGNKTVTFTLSPAEVLLLQTVRNLDEKALDDLQQFADFLLKKNPKSKTE